MTQSPVVIAKSKLQLGLPLTATDKAALAADAQRTAAASAPATAAAGASLGVIAATGTSTAADTSAALAALQKSQDTYGASNPPFDPRIKSWEKSGLGGAGTLQRGNIQQDSEYAKNAGLKSPFSCNFLYNPSEITVSYQGNTSVFPAQYQTGDSQAAAPVLSAMQSIDFSLLFDRTYEVAMLGGTEYSATTRKLMNDGAYADISALERVAGISRSAGSAYGGTGPLLPIPAILIFGQVGAAYGKFNGNSLQYYGYLSSMTVQYTHFSTGMVPMRATAAITFAQLAIDTGGSITQPFGPDAPYASQQSSVGTG